MANKIKQPICVICCRGKNNTASLGGNEPFALIPCIIDGIKEWRVFCGSCFNKIMQSLGKDFSLDFQNLFTYVDFAVVKQKGFNQLKIGNHGDF